MTARELYPLPFAPLFKSMLWGGRRLVEFLPNAPADGPLGEAWVLSDVAGNHSVVSAGPFAGRTLRDLLAEPEVRHAILGRGATDDRFPLLLKFIDARDHLSVQVHPDDEKAQLVGPLLRGKTEAWVVLHAEPGARLFAGLRPGVDEPTLRRALGDGTAADCLHSYAVRPGDCVFLPAGTVHAIGAGLFLFEVQQTSDITYRLFDWNRTDAKTGRPRELHIEHGLHATDFAAGPRDPVRPTLIRHEPTRHERLVGCQYFDLWRHHGDRTFAVGASGSARAVVCVEGRGELWFGGTSHPLRPGSAYLVPATVGACEIRPQGVVTILECGT